MGTPFKMKGSPMARNFGIGSPMKKATDPNKDEPTDPPTTPSDTTTTKKVKRVDMSTKSIWDAQWAKYQKTLKPGDPDYGKPAPAQLP